jgi:hypothetical protein
LDKDDFAAIFSGVPDAGDIFVFNYINVSAALAQLGRIWRWEAEPESAALLASLAQGWHLAQSVVT